MAPSEKLQGSHSCGKTPDINSSRLESSLQPMWCITVLSGNYGWLRGVGSWNITLYFCAQRYPAANRWGAAHLCSGVHAQKDRV